IRNLHLELHVSPSQDQSASPPSTRKTTRVRQYRGLESLDHQIESCAGFWRRRMEGDVLCGSG
ncbi:MAG: hypothetical protein PF795_12820, partial [Kiritimatiellae bacterium]|nr:hypothetical protein [Kiritimatiellia bacterium]